MPGLVTLGPNLLSQAELGLFLGYFDQEGNITGILEAPLEFTIHRLITQLSTVLREYTIR